MGFKSTVNLFRILILSTVHEWINLKKNTVKASRTEAPESQQKSVAETSTQESQLMPFATSWCWIVAVCSSDQHLGLSTWPTALSHVIW